jgi:hypothetical protein
MVRLDNSNGVAKMHVMSGFQQVVAYEGRAAVPLNFLIGGFKKVFFCQPRTFDLFGRVQVSFRYARSPLTEGHEPLQAYFRVLEFSGMLGSASLLVNRTTHPLKKGSHCTTAICRYCLCCPEWIMPGPTFAGAERPFGRLPVPSVFQMLHWAGNRPRCHALKLDYKFDVALYKIFCAQVWHTFVSHACAWCHVCGAMAQ